MYQREAMWISFDSRSPCAVKVSVGGINALTGTAQNALFNDKQDYLAVGGRNGQRMVSQPPLELFDVSSSP